MWRKLTHFDFSYWGSFLSVLFPFPCLTVKLINLIWYAAARCRPINYKLCFLLLTFISFMLRQREETKARFALTKVGVFLAGETPSDAAFHNLFAFHVSAYWMFVLLSCCRPSHVSSARRASLGSLQQGMQGAKWNRCSGAFLTRDRCPERRSTCDFKPMQPHHQDQALWWTVRMQQWVPMYLGSFLSLLVSCQELCGFLSDVCAN